MRRSTTRSVASRGAGGDRARTLGTEQLAAVRGGASYSLELDGLDCGLIQKMQGEKQSG